MLSNRDTFPPVSDMCAQIGDLRSVLSGKRAEVKKGRVSTPWRVRTSFKPKIFFISFKPKILFIMDNR